MFSSQFSSDEEEATRSFDIIVSRGGKREEVKRPGMYMFYKI